jgi:hypothetical protein
MGPHIDNRLTVSHRRALTLLAGAAKGMSEGLILALGFKSELIADLIGAELVTASTEYMGRGGSPVEVARLKITEAGRHAIADR